MADNVQWIKLKVGMFDGNSFKKIKRAKIGGVSYRDKLTAIWFELLDLAGKSNANGYLIDNNEIPYHSYEDIAIMLDRDEKEIELCMTFFINEKMVEIIDDIYCLTNFMQYQNQEGLEKIREQKRIAQAKWRERKRLGLVGVESTVDSTNNLLSYSTSTSLSVYESNSNKENDLLEYKEVLRIAQEECKAVYLRHSKQVDEKCNIAKAREVMSLLEDLQGQYSYDEIRSVFAHANMTYIVSPQYDSLDIAWVLKNIRKVMQTEMNENKNQQKADITRDLMAEMYWKYKAEEESDD